MSLLFVQNSQNRHYSVFESQHRPPHLPIMQLLVIYCILLPMCFLTYLSTASLALAFHPLSVSNLFSVHCFNKKEWEKPHWPLAVKQPYWSNLTRLHSGFVQPNSGARYEFLAEGEVPVCGLPMVRTPFKSTLGTVSLLFV